jgi:opacity protein-like surface antigen
MKKHLFLLFGALLTLAILTAPLYADNAYVSGNVGYTLSNDLNIKNTDGNVIIKLPLKTGINIQGALGAQFDNFRIEGEIGYQTKDIDLAGVNGSWKTLSLLANGYYDFTTKGIQPYVTAGIGAGRVTLSDFIVGGDTFIWDGGVTKLAYQLGAGVALPLTDNISIDVRYRYFALNDVIEGHLIKYTPSTNSILVGLRLGL